MDVKIKDDWCKVLHTTTLIGHFDPEARTFGMVDVNGKLETHLLDGREWRQS